jgi:urea transport system permease protein
MTSDSVIEIPGIERRHQRRRLQLIEVGVVALVALILIFLMPAVLPSVRLNQMGRFLALAIAALGIDLIWGYTGLLSLGHGIFFALGGYALAMHLQLAPIETGGLPEFMNLYGVTELPWFWKLFDSFGFAAVAVILIPGLIGAILGYLVFRNRIRGVYFSILTQAATIVFLTFSMVSKSCSTARMV